MDDNGSIVFREFELYLFQYIQQSSDEAYCRLFRSEATGFHIMVDRTCQLTQYVLPSCKNLEQGFYAQSGRATKNFKRMD